MSKELSVSDVVAEIFQSVLATPKRQRRLLSKTFWAKFGFKSRTKERIEQVRETLKQQGLIINLNDGEFGTEGHQDWIVLTYVEPELPSHSQDEGANPSPLPPIPRPSEDWFQRMAERQFESEREVEYYSIMPLLESLGYEEEDVAIGYPVEMYEGSSKVRKEADCVLFNGPHHGKENALLVVEAKKADKMLTSDAVGQAKGYAVWLATPYYLVTNGEEIRLFLCGGGLQADVELVRFLRADLPRHWETLYSHIGKAAVIERKAKLGNWLTANRI